MNLEELKTKRDARIKAKKERIKLDSGVQSGSTEETGSAQKSN
jgi:hypothetical protein